MRARQSHSVFQCSSIAVLPSYAPSYRINGGGSGNGGDDEVDDIVDDETMMTITSGWPSPRVSRKHHQSSKPSCPSIGYLSASFVGGSGSSNSRNGDEGYGG